VLFLRWNDAYGMVCIMIRVFDVSDRVHRLSCRDWNVENVAEEVLLPAERWVLLPAEKRSPRQGGVVKLGGFVCCQNCFFSKTEKPGRDSESPRGYSAYELLMVG
jgi:hypothetical protein